MQDKTATQILQRFSSEIKARRQVWDGHWQDIKELVRCDTSDFNRKTVQGYRRYDLVYDGTAINANEELASGLHSYLTSPTERWFELQIENQSKLNLDKASLQWLEDVSDIIYEQYGRPDVNFNPSIHECYLDLGSFGTAVINQEWNAGDQHLIFKAHPLAECYFVENNKGIVDTLWRYFEWTGRQITQEFGEKNIPTKLAVEINKPQGLDKYFHILHHVCPRSDRAYGDKSVKGKTFASYWLCEETSEMILESGYDMFPYHVTRWIKLGGETYGRGPAMKCLPDIKSLQAMERVMLKAGQKAVDPPMMVPDEGFMLPIKTSPGSINFKEPNSEPIEFLEFKGDVKFGLEQTNQKRDYIEKCFYSEWLKMEKDNKEMTAYETADRRDEKLRLMAPMLGRQQTELLGPLIQRSYSLLHSAGKIPPAPPLLRRQKLTILYTSPAARAQLGAKADRVSRFMQDLLPMQQVDPNCIDVLDTDQVVQVYATARGIPQKVLRSPQAVAQIRDAKQKQQQAQQMAATAEPASNALKNIATASKLTGGGSPGGPT